MPRREFLTDSEEATLALGRQLAADVSAPRLILLIGNLGSGKTTLAKGLISGLGVATPEEVTSPSFTLVHQYGPTPRVYHVDLYRVEAGRDMETLGLEDLFSQEAVVLVEWGEKLGGALSGPRWELHLDDLGGARRRIILEETDGSTDSHQQNEN